MIDRSLRRIALTLVALLLLPTIVFAQSAGSTLSGRITDPSGAAVPGVTVTAANTQTGTTRTTVTESDGTYRLLALPIGTYRVTAELSGFATVTTENVQLNVATARELNITLKQATVSEAITVTAESPLVATEPAVGTVVSQQELEGLPLNGRQFANLASLAARCRTSISKRCRNSRSRRCSTRPSTDVRPAACSPWSRKPARMISEEASMASSATRARSE